MHCADVVVAATEAPSRGTLWPELPSAAVPPDDQLLAYDECRLFPISKANMLTKSVSNVGTSAR